MHEVISPIGNDKNDQLCIYHQYLIFLILVCDFQDLHFEKKIMSPICTNVNSHIFIKLSLKMLPMA